MWIDPGAWSSHGGSVAEIAALALLLLYHGLLAWLWRRAPMRTHRGRSNRLRRAWVASMIDGDRDILAVQTMRNWTMSATLLASTAILIGAGLLSAVFSGADLSELGVHLSLVPRQPVFQRHLHLLLLALLFFAAFFHFVMTLRYYNHASYLINLPQSYFSEPAVDAVADIVNRGGTHYNRGMRTFLMSAPLSMWLIGPYWLLLGVLIGLVLLYRFDFAGVGERLSLAEPRRDDVGRGTESRDEEAGGASSSPPEAQDRR